MYLYANQAYDWRGSISLSSLLVAFVFLNIFIVDLTFAEENVRESRYKRAAEDNDIDPNVALEGQCVVVCDADVVARKPQIRPRPPAPVGETRNGPVNNFWETMQSAACGGLVNVGRQRRKVAFSVKRSTELTIPGTSDRTSVTFDHVMVNVGNGFDTERSTFVAPVSGVYSLSFQVYRIFNKNALTIDLHVNGVAVLRGVADGDVANHNSAHNSGLIHLEARDRVSLQTSGGNLESGWKYSTFSGYLVFEDNDI